MGSATHSGGHITRKPPNELVYASNVISLTGFHDTVATVQWGRAGDRAQKKIALFCDAGATGEFVVGRPDHLDSGSIQLEHPIVREQPIALGLTIS